MITSSLKTLSIYQFSNLVVPGVQQFVTTRAGGTSKGVYSSLNLALHVEDDPETVQKNRSLLADELAISQDSMVFANQIHGDRIKVVTEELKGQEIPNTDAFITNVPGICLMILTADCVPVLLYDPVTKAIGAVHAGWKGTVARIVAKTVLKMQETYGSDPKDVLVGIGPSNGPEDYEVGFRIRKEVHKAFPKKENFMKRNTKNEICLNMWAANRWQLENVGVKSTNIEVSGISTFAESETFFSDRKESPTGRFASGIYLK